MPPVLALTICSVFVLFLLWLEKKRMPGASNGLWIPTIWFVYTSSKALGTWFKAGGDMESGSPIDRMFLLALLGISLYMLSKRKFDFRDAGKKNAWPIIIILYMLISVIWSGMPAISFRRWAREIIPIFMAFLVLSEDKPRKALESLISRAIYVLIPFSITLIKYFPEYGRFYGRWTGNEEWVGVTYQKNSLALLCSFSVIFLIWRFIKQRNNKEPGVSGVVIYSDLLVFMLSIYLLGGPRHTPKHSVASSISLVIGLIVLLAILWGKKRGRVLSTSLIRIMIMLIIIYGTITPFLGKLTLFDISSYFGRDETLTGRAEIWAILIPHALNKPLLGHGFGGFWTTGLREMTSSHAHNGYLDAILNFGIIGLILIALYLSRCCERAVHVLGEDLYWGALFVCFVFMMVVHNIAESSIFEFSGPLSAAILLFYVTSCKSGPDVESELPEVG